MSELNIYEISTQDLWVESRQLAITLSRPSATTIQLDWIMPANTKVLDGYVVLLGIKPFDLSTIPIDGNRYTASTDLANPADTIGGAQVILSQHKVFNDVLTTTITVVNADPTKVYYASIHGASNVLQYYPVGIQSYPLEASRLERHSESFAGSIPTNDHIPTNPTLGQAWYNPVTNSVKMWNGAAWIDAGTGTVQTGTQAQLPTTPTQGQFFYDINSRDLLIYNGTGWNKANTADQGTPSYAKLGIGTDGSYDERQRLINTLKYQLGWPAVCVELSEENFNTAIDNALDEFRRRADNAYERRHVLVTLKPDQNVYFMNDPTIGTDRIVDVIKIHRVNAIGLNVLGGDNGIYAQIFYNQFFYGAMIDILSIHLAQSLAEDFERIFAGNLMYEWVESTRELKILRKIYRTEKVVMECVMERTEQELLVDRWAKQWLQGWSEMECLETLGMIRTKYGNLPGAGGGIALNGSELLSKAQEMETELLRQIQDFEAGNGGFGFGNCAFFMG